MTKHGLLAAMALVLGTSSSLAQTPPSPQEIAAQTGRMAQWRQKAPVGTGPFGSVRLVAKGLPGHTLYLPARMPRSAGPMPIIAFGNGGCRNTSIEFAAFLAEVASHGYLVAAVGTDDIPFGMAGTAPDGRPLQRAEPKALIEAVDWAIAENSRRASAYRGRIMTRKVAYVGQSCGGLQALNASVDPRTTTTVVLNSGYFKTPPPMMKLPAPLPWTSFRRPIAFFTGGKQDIAYGNAYANFADGTDVPMFIASRAVGHTGAYPGPDRKWADAVIGWLDWQLKGDRRKAAWFVGPDCGLCKDDSWSEVKSHRLP